MRWRSIRQSTLVLVVLTALILPGCATYRIQTNNGGPHSHSVVLWSLAWGLAQPENPIKRCEECDKQPLAVVSAKSNLAFDFISVLTLGFVSPIKLEWKHIQPTTDTGDVPEDTNGGE